MGAGGIIVIGRNVKAALSVGITPSGKYKIWHALIGTHGLAAALAGWFF